MSEWMDRIEGELVGYSLDILVIVDCGWILMAHLDNLNEAGMGGCFGSSSGCLLGASSRSSGLGGG